MPWRPVLLGLLVCAVGAAVLFVPFLTRERTVVAATPNPPPIFDVVPLVLEPGQALCVAGVVVPPDAQLARVRATAAGGTLRLRAFSGGGWRSEATVPVRPTTDVPLTAPRTTQTAEVCLDNAGARPFTLASTEEPRTASRTVTRRDAEMLEEDVTLLLLEREPASLASRLGTLAERASAFKPGLVSPGLLLALGALLLLGLPLGALLALRVEARDREPEPGEVQEREPREERGGVVGARAAREHATSGGRRHRDD